MRVHGKDGGPEPIHDNVNATAQKPSASEGTKGVRPSKMVTTSFEARSPLHSTKVPETSLMQDSATYEEGVSEGPGTEHKVANKKGWKSNDLKYPMEKSLPYQDPSVTRNIIVNSLTKVNTHLDTLAERARSKGGSSEGSETEHEATIKNDLRYINLKDSLAKVYTYSGYSAVGDRNKDGRT